MSSSRSLCLLSSRAVFLQLSASLDLNHSLRQLRGTLLVLQSCRVRGDRNGRGRRLHRSALVVFHRLEVGVVERLLGEDALRVVVDQHLVQEVNGVQVRQMRAVAVHKLGPRLLGKTIQKVVEVLVQLQVVLVCCILFRSRQVGNSEIKPEERKSRAGKN